MRLCVNELACALRRAEERARAPVNFPKNYAFSKNGTHLYAHTVAGWHGTKPENATISGDKENFYNTIAQALTADNKSLTPTAVGASSSSTG